MAVKFTKPEINVREKLAELDKPSGIAGEAMLRAETPQEQFNLIGAGRRNIIINGGFDVWQRGTSFTPATPYGYSADRTRLSSGSTVNITKESATLEGNVVNTIKHAIVSPTAGSNTRYDQRIEEFDYFKNKTFTLSFWIKSSRTHPLNSSMIFFGGGGINTVNFYDDYGLGDVTPTWTKKVITFSVGDLSTATGTYVDMVIGISSDGASIDIEYAQVQLEVGKVATPFEHRSYGEELALCQRYYHTLRSGIFGVGTAVGTVAFTYSSPVTMRATPTIGFKDSNDDMRVGDMVAQGHTINTCTIGTTSYSSVESQSWSVSGTPSAPQSTSLTTYRSYLLEPQSSNHGTFTFSSEL